MRGIDLGDVSFGLTADTAGLDRALGKLHAFSLAINKIARSNDEDASRLSSALARQERLIADTFQKIASLNTAIKNAGAPTQQITNLTSTFKSLVNQLTDGEITSIQFSRAQAQVAARLAESRRELNSWIADSEKAIAVERAWSQAIAEENRRVQNSGKRQAAAEVIDQSRTQQMGRVQAQAIAMNEARDRRIAALQAAAQAEDAARSTGKWAEALHNLGRASVLVNGPLSGIGARMTVLTQLFEDSTVKMALFVVGTSAVVAALGFVGAQAIKTGIQWEQWKSSMLAASGAAVLVNDDMKYVIDTSVKFGTSLQASIPAWTQFATSARLTGLTIKETKEVYEAFTTAGAALHWGADQTGRAFLALEQILSKGKPQLQEVKLQLGQVLPGAFELAAKGMKMSASDMSKALENGAIGAREFVLNMSKVVEETFRKASEAGRASTRAEIERFSTMSTLLSKSVDDATKSTQLFKLGLKTLNDFMLSLSKNMGDIVPIIAAVGGGFIALTALPIISGLATVSRGIWAVTAAMGALNVATLANPFAAVGSILLRLGLFGAGAAGVLYTLKKSQDSVTESTLEYKEALQQSIDAAKKAGEVDADQKNRIFAQKSELFAKLDEEQRKLKGVIDKWNQYNLSSGQVINTPTGPMVKGADGRVTLRPSVNPVTDEELTRAAHRIRAIQEEKKAIEEQTDRLRALRVKQTETQKIESEKQEKMRVHYEQEEEKRTLSAFEFKRKELERWRTDELKIAGTDNKLREYVEKDFQERLRKLNEEGLNGINDATQKAAEKRTAIEKKAADEIVYEQQKIIDAKMKAAEAAGNMEAAIAKAQTGETKDFFKEGDLLRIRNLVQRGYTTQDEELLNAVTAYTTKYNERPPGFARGGSFIVGGTGGTDTTLVQLMATPGERITVQTPEQQKSTGNIVANIYMSGVNDVATFARQLREYIRSNPEALSTSLVRAS